MPDTNGRPTTSELANLEGDGLPEEAVARHADIQSLWKTIYSLAWFCDRCDRWLAQAGEWEHHMLCSYCPECSKGGEAP